LADKSADVRWLTVIAVALGTFMQVLDTTIANVSIPTISGDLAVSADQGTWVITSFAVSNGISVPLTGWLMQRFGVVRTFVAAVVLFTVASGLCGLAWSLPSLVAFRVLQGAVSGPMIPGSQALLLMIFPPERRAVGLAVWSMTTLVAPVVGPILGGYISDNWSWPWIFYINLPVGIVSSLVCWRALKGRETPTRQLPVDWWGFGLLVVWVGSLQIMLDKGKDLDWFDSPQIVALAIVAAVGFAAFLIWELTERHPIVDLSLFRSRNFTAAALIMCLGYGVFFANLVLLPLLLQTQLGYTATWAGLVAAPSGIVAVLLSPFIGRMTGRIDARWLVGVALAAFAASYFMRAQLTPQASVGSFILPLAIQGVSMATFFVAVLAIMLQGLPQERVPSASGLSNFVRIVAGAFAASVVTTAWDHREALHQTQLAEAATRGTAGFEAATRALSSDGLTGTPALGALAHDAASQAYFMGALDIFWLSGWFSIALALLLVLARPSRGAAGAAAAAD
jgi:DHA2 family multidrug resistance protein